MRGLPECILAQSATVLPHQSVCLYVYPPIVARQRLRKNVTAATNTHSTTKEFLNMSSSMRFVSYERKVGDQFFPELIPAVLSSNDQNIVFVVCKGLCVTYKVGFEFDDWIY
jgi:hypothetical protein